MNNEAIQKIAEECVAKLGEHCDAVLILAAQSDADDEGHYTDGYTAFTGDFYARVGMAMIYLEKNKAVARARAISQDQS